MHRWWLATLTGHADTCLKEECTHGAAVQKLPTSCQQKGRGLPQYFWKNKILNYEVGAYEVTSNSCALELVHTSQILCQDLLLFFPFFFRFSLLVNVSNIRETRRYLWEAYVKQLYSSTLVVYICIEQRNIALRYWLGVCIPRHSISENYLLILHAPKLFDYCPVSIVTFASKPYWSKQ